MAREGPASANGSNGSNGPNGSGGGGVAGGGAEGRAGSVEGGIGQEALGATVWGRGVVGSVAGVPPLWSPGVSLVACCWSRICM